MAISGLLFDWLRDEDPRTGQRLIVLVAPGSPCRALLEEIHAEQHCHREDREHDRGGICPRQVDLVELRLDEERQGLRLAADVPGDDADRAELPERAGRSE